MSPKQTSKPTRKKGDGYGIGLKKSTSKSFPFLQNLVNILPEAVITTDIQTNITGWNAAAERMYGWKAAEVLGQPLERLLHTHYQNTDQDEAVATVLENGQWFNTVTQLRKDGTRIPVISSVSVIKDDEDKPVGYVGINRDFTRESLVTEAARQQGETTEQILDMLPAAVWVASDPQCKFIYGNRYANDLLNAQDGENVSQSAEKPALRVRHFVNGRELSTDEMPMQAAARTGQPQKNIEMRIESDRFEPRILLGDSAPLFDEHGKPRGAVATFHDITERRQEEDLRESQAMLQSVLDAAPDAMVVINKKGEIILTDQQVEAVFGYGQSELVGQSILLLVPERFRTAHTKHEQNYFLSPRHRTDSPLELFALRKDGTEFPAEININHHKVGEELVAIASIRDVTERKKVQAELQEGERKFSALFNQFHDAVFLLDLQGRHLNANQRAADILGYTREELSGLSFHEVSAEPAQSQNIIERLLKGEHFPVYEHLFRRKNGDLLPVEINIELVRDAHGTPMHLQCVVRDISERKKAEEKLQASELRYRSLVENMHEIVMETDADGIFRYLSPNYEAFSGYAISEELGTSAFTHVHPEDQDMLQQRLAQVARDGFGTLTYRVQVKSGAWVWVETTARLSQAEDGSLRIIGVARDITNRIHTEKQLQQMKRLYATLSQVNQTIVRVKEQGELFQSICDMVVKFGEYSLAWVGLLEESGEIQPVAAKGMDIHHWTLPIINIHKEEFKSNLSTQAIQTGKVITSEDVQSDLRLSAMQDSIKKLPYHAVAVVPIKRSGRAIGILVIISPDSGFFKDKEELALLEEMGMDISFALDMMENERIKQQWADAFEHSAHGMVIGDARTNTIRACNPAFAREQGISMEEAVGMRLIDLYRPEDHDHIKKLIAQSDREGMVQFEGVKLRKDGSAYPFQLDLVSVRDENGNLLYRVASQQDITERKQAEEALLESEARYKLLFESNPHPMWVYDLETLAFLMVNDAAVNEYGYSREEFKNLTLKDIRPAEDVPALIQNVSEETDTLQRSDGWRHRRKDGSTLDVEITSHWLLFGDRNARLVLVNDVTKRKQAEKALKENEERLRLSLHAANQGMYDLNIQTGDAVVNREYAEMLGYDPDTFVETNDAWVARLHPDDRDITAQVYSDYISGRIPEYRVEFRQRTANGNWKWLLSIGKIVEYDSQGQPLRMLGTHTDITERKQAEDAIRISEERFRVAFRDLPIVVFNQDLELRYTWIANPNPGFSNTEIIGKTDFDLLPPENARRLEEIKLNVISSGLGARNEVITNIGGVNYYYDLFVEPLRDSTGENIIGITCASLDITQRKVAEEKLHASEERFRSALDGMLEGVQILGFDWRYIYLNHSAEIHNRRPNSELIGNIYMDMWPGIENTHVFEVIKSCLENRVPTKLENEFTYPDGLIQWFDLSIQPTPEGVLIHSVDITERKQTEEALRMETERFRHFASSNIVGIVIADASGKINLANDYYLNLLGVTRQDFLDGKVDWRIFTPPEWIPVDEKALAELKERGICEPYEKEYIRADGTRVPVYIADAMLPGSSNEIAAFILDITERKQKEDALQAEQIRFSSVAASMPGAICTFHLRPDGMLNIPYASKAFEDIFGLTLDDVSQNIDAIIQRVPPDDAKRLVDAVQVSAQSMLPWREEYQFQHPIKGTIWLEGYSMPVREADGSISWYGVTSDITERKKIEEERADIHSRLERITTHIPGFVFQFLLTPDGKFSVPYASAGIYDLYEVTPEQVRQDATAIFNSVHPEDAERVRMKIMESAEKLIPWHEENRILLPSGKIKWVEGHSTPQKEKDGSIVWYGFTQDVTERKQAEQIIRESESKYRLLAENITDVIWILDIETSCFRYVSPSVEQLRGYTAEEVLHQSITEALTPPSVEYLAQTLPARLELLGKGLNESHTDELEQPCKDGSTVWTETTTRFISNPETGHMEVYGVSRDISERKQAETALRVSEENYRNLVETSDSAIAVLNREGVILYANPAAARIWDDPQIVGKSVHDLYPAEVADSYLVAFNAVLDDQVIDLSEVETTINGQTMWFRVSLSPIKNDDGSVNALLLNAWDITERKQAEKALSDNEQHYRALFEDVPIAIWEQDFSEIKKYLTSLTSRGVSDLRAYFAEHPEELLFCQSLTRITNVNQTGLLMYEAKDKQELINATMQAASQGELVNGVEELIAIAEGKTNHSWEGGDETLTGKLIEIQMNWSVVPGHEQDYSKVIVTTMDITERRQAEEKLLASEAKFKAVFDNAPVGISLLDPKRSLLDSNEMLARIIRINKDEMSAGAYRSRKYIREDGTEILASELASTRAINERTIVRNVVNGIVLEDGEVIWTQVSAAPLGATDTGIVVITQDITERKQAEEALRRSEALLAEAQRIGKIGHWEWTAPGRNLICSDELFQILEIDPQPDRVISQFTISDMLAPEERERLVGLDQTAFANRANTDYEYQVHLPSGKNIWLHQLAKITYGEDGKPIRMMGIIQDVTERKQVEEALIQSEERHRQISSLISDYAYSGIILPDGKIKTEWVSGAFERITGYTLEEINQLPAGFASLIQHEQLVTIIEKRAEFRSKSSHTIEYTIRRKDGEIRWLRDYSTYHDTDEVGTSNRITGAVQDITERKQAEDSLKQSERVLRLFVEHSPASIAMFDRDMKYIVHSRRYVQDYQLPDQDLTGRSHYDVFPEIPERWKDIHQRCLAGNIERADEDPFPRLDGHVDYVHWEIHPWYDDNGMVGGIILFSEVVTERVLAREELADKNKELMGIAHQLEESRNMLELIIDSAPIRVFWKDRESRYLGSNRLFARDAGYDDPDEIIGKLDDEMVWKDKAETFQQQERELIKTGTPRMNMEELQKTPDGGSMWVNVSMVPLKDLKGEVIGTLGIYEDITERIKAEEAVRQSEALFSKVFQASSIGINIFRIADGVSVSANDAFLESIGYSREEVIGHSAAELDLFVDIEARNAWMKTLKEGGLVRNQDAKIRTKNGEIKEWLASLDVIEINGESMILVLATDITERKQAEQKIRESEALLRQVLESSQDSIFAIDKDYRLLVNNERHQQVLTETGGHPLRVGESILPPDFLPEVLEQWRGMYDRTFNNEAFKWEIEWPYVEGKLHTIENNFSPLRDATGTIKGALVVIRDITENKQAEKALRESEERFSTAFFTSPVSQSIITQGTNEILAVNDACCQLFEYSREELIGVNTGKLNLWTDPAERLSAVEELKRTGRVLPREVTTRMKSGKLRTVIAEIEPISWQGIPCLISTIFDITERKQAETSLTQKLAELELLYQSGLALNGELQQKQVAEKLIEALEGKMYWHHVAIRKYDPEGDHLELLAFNQPGIENEEQKQALAEHFNKLIPNSTQGLSGWVVRHGQTVRLENVRADERYASTHPNIHSGIYTPMMLGDRVVGVISVESEELNAFSASDERLLKTIANQAAVAFENARLFQDVQHELAERIQAEKSLRQSEERYRQTLDTMMEGCQIIGFDWQYLYVNDAGAQQGHSTREALIGKTMMEMYPGIETTEVFETLRDCMENRVIRRMENEFQFADGTNGWFDLNIQPVPEGIFILSFDITERKQAEKAIHRYNKQLAEVVEIEYSLAASLDQEHIYDTLQRGIHHLLPDIATIFFSSFDAERGVIKAQYGLQDNEPVDVSNLPELPYKSDGQGTQSRVIRTRQPLIINSDLKNAFKQPVQVGTDERITQSALYVPMLVQDQVLGVLQVQSYSPNRFTDEDAKVLLLIANTAAVTIQNARLFELAQKEIIDRTQAESALRTSEERLRMTLQTTSDGFWIIDASGRFLEINNAYCEMSGYSREELLQMSISDVEAFEGSQEIKERIEKVQHEDHDRFETRHRRKDGSEFDVEVSVNLLDGESKVMICFCRDITERKQAESEIIQRTEDLLLINVLNDAANRGESIEAITEIFTRETRKMFNCQDAAIYMLSPDGQYLEMQSTTISANLIEQIETVIGVKIPRIKIPVRPGSYTEWLISKKEGTLSNDPQEIQKWIQEFTETTFLPAILQTAFKKFIPAIFKLLKINSTITVPLLSFDRIIGLLDMSSNSELTSQDLQRVRILSHQMTAVILRKQAEENVRIQLKRITALNEIDRAISSSLDMRLSLDVLLNEVTSQLRVDAASILLLDPIDQTLDYTAGKGFRTNNIRNSHLRLGQGFAGQVGLERRVLHVPDLAKAGPNYLRADLLKAENFIEYFGVPLIAKGLLKGVLEIFNRTPITTDPDWMNYLETLGGQAAIAVDNAQLFEGMQRSNQELVTAYDATIAGWSLAMDLRDKETEGHTQRVTELTLKLAKRLGISEHEQIQMRRGALLHDIGKLGVPDDILLKPGKLTDEEWEIMRQHPTHAYEMLLPIKYLRPALDIPYAHHEKWDGTGYPRKLQGEQIPLAARIFAIIDVWDALRSDRPYRPGWSVERVREHILEQSGKHFDPFVVNAFMKLLDDSPDIS